MRALLLAAILAWAGLENAAAAPASLATTPIDRLSTPWWKARFAEKQRELAAEPAELVWVGDSITQNWEKTGPEPWENYAPAWRRFYGDRHAVNLGFKGDSTCHVLWRLDHGELRLLHPKVVVLLIGANNFGHVHTDAEATAAGIRKILAELHGQAPAARIIVIGVLPSIRSAWVDENTTRVNRILAQDLADSAFATFVDLRNLFLTDGRIDPRHFIDPRNHPPEPPLHPDAETQARMAAAIEPLVARGLGDRIHG